MSSLRLLARRCLVGDSDWREACIEVRAGRIVAIEPVDAGTKADVDLGDRLVVPGFVNAHTHLAMHGLRGVKAADDLRGNMVEDLFYAWESALDADDVRAFARVAALECVLHGVTAVFDHYYFAEAVASALVDVGLAGVVAPTLQDRGGPGRDASAAALESTRALHSDSWKDRGIAAAVGPHATDTVSADLWRRALDLASELGIPLHAHLAQSVEEVERARERHGASPLGWLAAEGLLDVDVPQLLVHALYLSGADLDRLDPSRHVLGSCPFSQMQFGFPAPVEEWRRRGVSWVVGTDCGPSNDSMNVQKELRVLAGQSTYAVRYGDDFARMLGDEDAAGAVDARRRRSIDDHAAMRDPRTLLASVWSVPGSWHPDLPTGAIEVGRRADLAVFDAEHPALWPGHHPLTALAYADPSPALWGLMVGGRWIGEPGDVAALLRRDDTREWIDEARRRRELLERRLAR